MTLIHIWFEKVGKREGEGEGGLLEWYIVLIMIS
jgi:hypothetical protein